MISGVSAVIFHGFQKMEWSLTKIENMELHSLCELFSQAILGDGSEMVDMP